MPNTDTITITDRDANDHAFSFQKEQDGVFTFAEPDANGVPIGESKLTASVRATPSKRNVRIRLAVPKVVTETINGVTIPKKLFDNFVDVSFSFDKTSTTDDRTLLLGMIADALNSHEVMDDVIIDLQTFR